MEFEDALKELVKGNRVRRKEWDDREICVALIDEKLKIFDTKDKLFHPLIVSLGDIEGADWVVVKTVSVSLNN